MNDDKVDLSPLAPNDIEPRALGIAADAMAARRARFAQRDVFAALGGFTRPLLAAAAIIAIVAVPLLASMVPRRGPITDATPATDILGVPMQLRQLTQRSEPPTLMELASAFQPSAEGVGHDR